MNINTILYKLIIFIFNNIKKKNNRCQNLYEYWNQTRNEIDDFLRTNPTLILMSLVCIFYYFLIIKLII